MEKQDVLCCQDYSQSVVDSFAHQIQSEYYGINWYVSIEGVSLEHFSEPAQTETPGTPQSRRSQSVFHSFFSDDRKQDSSTTISHIKCIIELLNQRNIISNTLIKIWENTDGCAEHYRCDTALYPM